MRRPPYKLFELSGSTLAAAHKLIADRDALFPAESFDPERDRARFKKFCTDHKTEMDALGMNAPAIHVEIHDGAFNRAYAYITELYEGPTGSGRVFAEVPVAYDGRHFALAETKPLDEAATAEIQKWLANGYPQTFSLPVAYLPERVGVAMPKDFDPAKHSSSFVPVPFDQESMSKIYDCVQMLRDAFSQAVGAPAAEVTFIPRLGCGPKRGAELLLRAYHNPARQTLPIQSTPWFNAAAAEDGYYAIQPKTGADGAAVSTEGAVLRHVLEEEIGPCPDAMRMWEDADRRDKANHVEPPPFPFVRAAIP